MAYKIQLLLWGVLLISHVFTAPVAQDLETTKAAETKPHVADGTVEQLEKLKHDPSQDEHKIPEQPNVAQAPSAPAGEGAGVLPVHAHDPTTLAPELTTKVFHGAGRLIQAGLGSSAPVHTAVRRSFNADITKETNNNMDHYSSYSGVQYSPLDMAEYVFWTGDEQGVTNAVEQFLQEGMMSKEEAIQFLQEIKFNIEYLRAHLAQEREDSAQQETLRMMAAQAAYAENNDPSRYSALQSFPFGNSPDIIKSINNKNWELSNNLTPYIGLPVSSDLRPEPVKRNVDQMMKTNILSTSDYDRDGPVISEAEFEEIMEKLKAADSVYTQYTLEEVIYQLSKVMFAQSMARDPAASRAATQRFMRFLEAEADRGQLSRNIEKRVLDIMMAALSDTVGDHQEMTPQRDSYGQPVSRLPHQFMDTVSSEPGMSRAILAAYKDELIKGTPMKYGPTK